MAYACPDDFITVAEAFEQAVKALCTVSALSVESWTPERSAENEEPREPNSFEKYDEERRRIERLMRDAIADGDLGAYILTISGQFERLIERECFRQMSLGIPGFENVPHHLTSPGPDTDGQPVLLKKNDFRNWITQFGKAKRSGRKPKFDWDDAKAFAQQEWNKRGPFNNVDTGWKSNADLERLVADYMSRHDDKGEPSTSVLKEHVSAWVLEFQVDN
jgi:hypothetical protein